jgi:hypothetical protein
MNLVVGDSVIVKQGIKEPDSEEFEISGWQGRIIEINNDADEDNILITIEWDSLTLEQLPSSFIQQSEIDGHDWQCMILYDSDLDKSIPRDKKENVKKIQDKLFDKYYWASSGDEGLRISNVLGNAKRKNVMKCYEIWDKHLDENLSFPIPAIVEESEDSYLIKSGDKLLIKSLSNFVDMYGIIAKVKLDRKTYEFPLCDLEVMDKKSKDYQLINDYRIWFANKS